MNRSILRLIVSVFLIFAMENGAVAHHGFASEFDAKAPVLLKGKVTKVELINPHAWIHLKVEEPGKPAQDWMVEGGTPNTLLRAGITRDTLKVGTEIVVRGYQSIDKSCKPKCKANGRDITLPDGKKVFIKSGEGVPDDDEHAPEKTPEKSQKKKDK